MESLTLACLPVLWVALAMLWDMRGSRRDRGRRLFGAELADADVAATVVEVDSGLPAAPPCQPAKNASHLTGGQSCGRVGHATGKAKRAFLRNRLFVWRVGRFLERRAADDDGVPHLPRPSAKPA